MTDSRVDEILKQWLSKRDNYFSDLGALGCAIDGDGYKFSELKSALAKLLVDEVTKLWIIQSSYGDNVYSKAIDDAIKKIEEMFSTKL